MKTDLSSTTALLKEPLLRPRIRFIRICHLLTTKTLALQGPCSWNKPAQLPFVPSKAIKDTASAREK